MIEACRTCLKLIRLECSSYFEIEGADVQLFPDSNRFKILSVMPEMALNISKKSLICTSCHQSLETIYRFKAKCLRTESMIMRYIHSRPDLEIEALDLKDVALVNNTGFVAGNSPYENTNTHSKSKNNRGNVSLNAGHSKTNSNLETNRGKEKHASQSSLETNQHNLLDKEKNTSHSMSNSLLQKKLLDRVNASLGNNNSISLHLIGSINAEKSGKDNPQRRAAPDEGLGANRRNDSRCGVVRTNRSQNLGCKVTNQCENSRCEDVGRNGYKNQVESITPQKVSNSRTKNGAEGNELPCRSYENVAIKEEFVAEDEDSADNEDAGVDVDESITVVKHELVNDDDETELIIPPENTILNVSVKSDKPVVEKKVENDRPTKYDLRKRVCNKTESPQKKNAKEKIMKVVHPPEHKNEDASKDIGVVNATFDADKGKVGDVKIINPSNKGDSSVDAQDEVGKDVKETNTIPSSDDRKPEALDSSCDTNASDVDGTGCVPDENGDNSDDTRNTSKYSLRNHATNKGKGLTTVRLKCVGSNLSIRRVIPNTDIKSYKVETESKNSEISVIPLAEKQEPDNQSQLPHLSVIPVIKKCNEAKPMEGGVEFVSIPINKSTEDNDNKDLTEAKSEDVKLEDAEPISMEVDVILNESIKSNDSGIQNTSGSEQTADDALFRCQVCLKNFITKSRLKTHMLCHTDERPYKCTLCIKGFNDKSTLNKHLKIHSGIKEYECEICQRQFYCKGNLNKHMSTHSGERPYRCNVCSRDFSRNEHLKQHRLIHTGDKNFECDICSKKFARRDSLIIHMMVHTGVRNYVCEYCDKRCIDSSTLKKHLRSHTGDKPYECETCHRRFTQKTHLTIHRRKHTGERPYNCTVCSKGFYSSNYLKIHKRTHTKEQPYQCDVCKKRFSTVSNLRMHKKIHTGIRDFECGICSKMFIHKHDLRKHMMVHTQEKPFSCHVCGKAFNKKVRAKQHIVNMHKDVDISTIVIEHHNTYVKAEPKAGSAN